MSKTKSKSKRRQTHPSRKPSHSAAYSKPSRTRFILLIGITVVALSAAGFLLLQDQQPLVGAAPSHITVAQAFDKYNQGALLVDVRTQEEWEEFHAPNTTWIPLDELVDRVTELPKNQEIVVICRSGNRSQEGRDILLNAGFTAVSSMDGGLRDWKIAGYPTISGP
jgi:rhodanese-related sulfurtransferase